MNLQKRLIEITKKECKENDIKFYLGKGKSVNYEKTIRVNGFFDSDNKKLACATGRPNWELILVHELNHLLQWKENSKLWKDFQKNSTNIIDLAISGQTVDEKKLHDATMTVLLLEHDCEYRSHQMLKNLGYSKQKLMEYTQKANAYALFYLYVSKNKKWYQIGREPYNLKEVWKNFPKTFKIDIHKTYQKLSHHYTKCVK